MNPLIFFLIWAVVIFLMMRFGCGAHVMGHGSAKNGQRGRGGTEELRWDPPTKDVDPVCGKTVSTNSAKPSVHEGSVYYFCSRECREVFEAAPDLYVGPEAKSQLAPETDGSQSQLEDHHA